MKYNHLQVGKITIASVFVASIISIYFIMLQDYSRFAPNWMDTSDWNWWGIGIVVAIYIVVLNFTTMRVQIDKDNLTWHFGVGIPKKTIQLEDIESVEQVRNKWWYGWGIRKLLSGGWLYNVSGLDAVEVKTRHGKIVRLGTDEPKKLNRALLAVINSASQVRDDG